MAYAAKCNDCGALADSMPKHEEFVFRFRNGDRKLEMEILFSTPILTGPNLPEEPRRRRYCNVCKVKYLRKVIEQLQARKEGNGI